MANKLDPFSSTDRFNSNEWPEIRGFQWTDDSSVEIDIFVGEDVRWFEGHFPNQPVLPGVAQTHWASSFGVFLFSPEGISASLENIKFSEILTPRTPCLLNLEFSTIKNAISFKYHFEDHLYSQGRICFK